VLSAEQLAGILNLTLTRVGGADSRRAPRVECSGRVRVRLGPEGAAFDAEVKDLSVRGIGIIFPRRLERGASFVTHQGRLVGPGVEVLCVAAHCREVSQGRYLIGAEFAGVIEPSPQPATELEAARVRRALLDEPGAPRRPLA
jgi:hypothetical protein